MALRGQLWIVNCDGMFLTLKLAMYGSRVSVPREVMTLLSHLPFIVLSQCDYRLVTHTWGLHHIGHRRISDAAACLFVVTRVREMVSTHGVLDEGAVRRWRCSRRTSAGHPHITSHTNLRGRKSSESNPVLTNPGSKPRESSLDLLQVPNSPKGKFGKKKEGLVFIRPLRLEDKYGLDTEASHLSGR